MTAAVLEARDVTMVFGGLVALSDVSLQLGERQIVGLIGPNGAGKTTFFNCLTGLYTPSRGEVRLHGRRLPGDPAKVTAAGVARTFQNIRLFPSMTALENVLVGRHVRMRQGPLSSLFHGPKFRSGEAAARERSRELLDEPTAGMNPQETEATRRLIFAIRDTGISVVVIEHDTKFIFSLCDDVSVLVQGELLVRGSPDVVRADPRVIEAYLGKPAEEIQAEVYGGEPT